MHINKHINNSAEGGYTSKTEASQPCVLRGCAFHHCRRPLQNGKVVHLKTCSLVRADGNELRNFCARCASPGYTFPFHSEPSTDPHLMLFSPSPSNDPFHFHRRIIKIMIDSYEHLLFHQIYPIGRLFSPLDHMGHCPPQRRSSVFFPP